MQHDATILGVHHDFKWFPDYGMKPWSHSESVNELGLSGSVRSKRLKSNKLPPWPQARLGRGSRLMAYSWHLTCRLAPPSSPSGVPRKQSLNRAGEKKKKTSHGRGFKVHWCNDQCNGWNPTSATWNLKWLGRYLPCQVLAATHFWGNNINGNQSCGHF
jgi:hypothetical protein